MVYGELERFPLFINTSIRVLNYWLRVTQLDPSRLPNQAYRMLFNLDQLGKWNWVSSVRHLLSSYGFYYAWLQQGVGNNHMFLAAIKVRLQDVFRQEWTATIRDKTRYELFRTFKDNFATESYIIDIDIYCFRVALSMFRFGVLPINNNTFRFNNDLLNRNCIICKNIVEDEHHFIYICPLYKDLRTRFLADRPPLLVDLFRRKDARHVRDFSKFIYHAFHRRNTLFHNC